MICFGAGRRGLATSKQRISHWVRDAISLAYEVQNLPSPLGLRAHSTRGVASSQALFRGVTPLSGFTTLTLIRLRVLRYCLFEPTVCCWFIFGPDRQLFSLACLVYRSQSVLKLRSVKLPMKENVSGYSRNPCSLNRERDTAFAAKLLTLPTGFFSAEKSEEWMARSPVWPDNVIASETASRHQPMNWRDSIWVQDSVRSGRSQSVLKLRSVSFPIQRTRVTRVTRDVWGGCYVGKLFLKGGHHILLQNVTVHVGIQYWGKFPSINCSSPVPAVVMQPQTLMLPPPLTVTRHNFLGSPHQDSSPSINIFVKP